MDFISRYWGIDHHWPEKYNIYISQCTNTSEAISEFATSIKVFRLGLINPISQDPTVRILHRDIVQNTVKYSALKTLTFIKRIYTIVICCIKWLFSMTH